MPKINPYILSHKTKSYANASDVPCRLDCSLGVNPANLPESVLEALRSTPEWVVRHYPHDLAVAGAILKKFSAAKADGDNICLGSGSYDLLCGVNSLYLSVGKTVFGYAPQFSAYTDHVRCIGANYRYYALKQERGFAFSVNEFIDQMQKSGAALVCVENPNNPTGQMIPLDDIEAIVQAAAQIDAALVVDEAYGDYMPPENSAVCLVNRYDHLFVTRTFSKGFGMAGIRMGYAFGSKEPMEQLKKLVTPFNCNALARRLATAILSEDRFAEELMEKTCSKKTTVLSSLQSMPGLWAAHTDKHTPIMLLYTQNENIDLRHVLGQAGIAAVSGLSYDNLGKNSVRIMLCDDTGLLIELLKNTATSMNN